MAKNLSERQAFEAMFLFLKQHYQRTRSDDIGALLGDMRMLSDGQTADPAIWHEWLKLVAEVRTKNES